MAGATLKHPVIEQMATLIQERSDALAEVERLKDELDVRVPIAQLEASVAEAGRLRDALHTAIRLARDFNRGAMTWKEYDRKLAALEVAHPPSSDRTAPMSDL